MFHAGSSTSSNEQVASRSDGSLSGKVPASRKELPSQVEVQAVPAGFRMVKSGLPGHGAILHYGQLHSVHIPGVLEAPGASYGFSAKLRAKVVRCQRAIFDDLLAKRIKHVFAEGIEEISMADQASDESAMGKMRDRARTVFQGYQPGAALTAGQEKFIFVDGATTCGLVAPGVTLHPTTTPERSALLNAFLVANRDRLAADNFNVRDADWPAWHHKAEQVAMAQVRRVMQGKSLTVALIFGSAHKAEKFASYCDEDHSCRDSFSKISRYDRIDAAWMAPAGRRWRHALSWR